MTKKNISPAKRASNCRQWGPQCGFQSHSPHPSFTLCTWKSRVDSRRSLGPLHSSPHFNFNKRPNSRVQWIRPRVNSQVDSWRKKNVYKGSLRREDARRTWTGDTLKTTLSPGAHDLTHLNENKFSMELESWWGLFRVRISFSTVSAHGGLSGILRRHNPRGVQFIWPFNILCPFFYGGI